jgi:indole-3-glycerol phosphate synthase/phosphoribosylanthranilate isomerase/anthranilate synthase/indole-3-glycerol phosphate synthase/phosphoribosylanthranilate isomerase
MSTKVKICGIRTLEAAQTAVSCGADFLGFNFIESSPRYILPQKAMDIISYFPREIKMVGVFGKEKQQAIIEIVEKLKIDFIQLHHIGHLHLSELTQYAGVIRAFHLPPHFEAYQMRKAIEEGDFDFALLDREVQGEGEILNPSTVREVSIHHEIFLAGGLTPSNVRGVVKIAQPYAVDVASGIEKEGEQDLEKIRLFIQNTKSI